MRICSNCGATNSDDEALACNKCGALLPVQSRRRRISLPQSIDKDDDDDIKIIGEETISTNEDREIDISIEDDSELNSESTSTIEAAIDLQEIPPTEESLEEKARNIEQQNKTNVISPQGPNLNLNNHQITQKQKYDSNERNNSDKKSDVLQEIAPQPFSGSIISSKNVSDKPPTKPLPATKPLPSKQTSINTKSLEEIINEPESEEIINDNLEIESLNEKELLEPPTQDAPSSEKHKLLELEEDMTKVLKFLSSKLKTNTEVQTDKSPAIEEKLIEEKIKPANMNEILKKLLTIDTYIEAGALIKNDGTILAAAVSGRFSDSLFATIGQNLSMIGADIIHGLSAGDLESISICGSEGILDIAPLNDKKSPIIKGIILMIFSHPKVKRGIINLAVNNITKEIIEYLSS